MTVEAAIKSIRIAMRVVVDAILDENSDPKESYQSKYDHLRAIDEEVLAALHKAKKGTTVRGKKVMDYYRLGKKIHDLYHEKGPFSFTLTGIKPQRWMFKAMTY